ncbi:small secreted [Fusarium longipes]|uniref:NADH dehydrogenase [ubiquinone] 1 alpha subcomplex subunit 1 n=1 Tax=Fusarium longipes TaxID=694270 RepID=A0A395SZM1_9HYPO|nr:small secreted [Fusarium longipes]
MPVPFEALLPYAIMIGMFGISGTGLAVIKNYQNEGKRPRYSVDQWDRQSMIQSSETGRVNNADLGISDGT